MVTYSCTWLTFCIQDLQCLQTVYKDHFLSFILCLAINSFVSVTKEATASFDIVNSTISRLSVLHDDITKHHGIGLLASRCFEWRNMTVKHPSVWLSLRRLVTFFKIFLAPFTKFFLTYLLTPDIFDGAHRWSQRDVTYAASHDRTGCRCNTNGMFILIGWCASDSDRRRQCHRVLSDRGLCLAIHVIRIS